MQKDELDFVGVDKQTAKAVAAMQLSVLNLLFSLQISCFSYLFADKCECFVFILKWNLTVFHHILCAEQMIFKTVNARPQQFWIDNRT